MRMLLSLPRPALFAIILWFFFAFFPLTQCLKCSEDGTCPPVNAEDQNPSGLDSSTNSYTSQTNENPASTATTDQNSDRVRDSAIHEHDRHEINSNYATNDENDDDDTSFDQALVSFEEWRKRALSQSGQSDGDAEIGARQMHLRNSRSVQQQENNYIEDDLEIDINMFGLKEPQVGSQTQQQQGQEQDDGGKVYKDRFNYASFDCAATIVKTNKNIKGANNILSENKDTYLLNQCSEKNKFVVIELCQDILVDTVVLANFEFFSSMFRHVRISVSAVYPPVGSDSENNGWKILGDFEARSVRELQYFRIANPWIWARFIRIEILSHWGHEFYCPISLVRVYGTTMMDEYRSEERRTIEDNADGDAPLPTLNSRVPILSDEARQDYTSLSIQNNISTTTTTYTHTIEKGSRDSSANIASSLSSSSSPMGPPSRTSSSVDDALSSTTSELCDALFSSNVNLTCLSPVQFNETCMWDEYIRNNSVANNGNVSDVNGKNLTGTGGSVVPPTHASVPTSKMTARAQDSIYQTIMKRLVFLESNATLSLQYIEEQSKTVRELLAKIDKKHGNRIESFFFNLNDTVNHQIRAFQQQYARLLLSTVDELQAQRIQFDSDTSMLTSRMSLLTDELMYQKKLGIAQAVILLTILIFVIVTRGTTIDSYSVSLHQQRQRNLPKRSHSAVFGLGSFFSGSPSSPTGSIWRKFSSQYDRSSFVNSAVEDEGDDDDPLDDDTLDEQDSSVLGSTVSTTTLITPSSSPPSLGSPIGYPPSQLTQRPVSFQKGTQSDPKLRRRFSK